MINSLLKYETQKASPKHKHVLILIVVVSIVIQPVVLIIMPTVLAPEKLHAKLHVQVDFTLIQQMTLSVSHVQRI